MPPPRDSARPTLQLIALLIVAHTSFGGTRLGITLQAVRLDASPVVIGLLLGLLMVVPSFVAVAIGRWADRAGFAPPTLWGLALLCSAELMAALHPSLPVLAVASVLVGTGYTLAHVAVNNAIGQSVAAQGRVRAFGFTAMGFSLSALAGPLAAGLAIDHLGHRAAFALMALLPVGSALLVRQLRQLAVPQDAPPPAAAAGTPAGGLLRHAPLRQVLVASALVAMGWDLFTFLVPLHGARQGLSASAIGLVVGAFGGGSFGARLALPWLTRRHAEWPLLRFALGFGALGYSAFPFCTSAGPMMALSFALGLVLGCGQPLVMSLLLAAAPAGRTGEAVGVRAAITSVGQTVLPLLFGALGTAAGMMPLFWAAAAVLGGGSWHAARAAREAGSELPR